MYLPYHLSIKLCDQCSHACRKFVYKLLANPRHSVQDVLSKRCPSVSTRPTFATSMSRINIQNNYIVHSLAIILTNQDRALATGLDHLH